MEFLKKHYEKVLLGVVLLGLTIAVAMLPVFINMERQKLAEVANKKLRGKVEPLPPLDLAPQEASLTRMQTAVHYEFAHQHNLFNPVLWEKSADGHPVKATGRELGPDAVQVTNIKPLYLQLTFNSVSGKSYLVGVENEAAKDPGKRHTEKLATKDVKNDLFTLTDVKGAPESPSELDITLNETGESISIGPTNSFRRIGGYAADIKYPPENRTWTGRRVGDTLNFNNSQYNIVAITQTNVVLSARQNEKKTTITFNPSNEATETR